MIPEEWIILIARACHEANRSYCELIGDTSQTSWEEAPSWQKVSAERGVLGVFCGNGPRESHESWLREKMEAGWRYGEVKNAIVKTHPCMVPYDDLPEAQRKKDEIFVKVARLLIEARGL